MVLKYIKTGLVGQMQHPFHPQQVHPHQMMAQPMQTQGERKYVGAVASGYDDKRMASNKWKVEQQIIEDIISTFPAGSRVLDAPCGTGRFFEAYAKAGHVVRAFDVSADMLQEASKKVPEDVKTKQIDGEPMWAFKMGDLMEGTGVDDGFVDLVIGCRITRWIMGAHGEEGITRLLKEYQRVSKDTVVFTARIRNHPKAVSLDLIANSLEPGWVIDKNIKGYEEDYRIFVLKKDV